MTQVISTEVEETILGFLQDYLEVERELATEDESAKRTAEEVSDLIDHLVKESR